MVNENGWLKARLISVQQIISGGIIPLPPPEFFDRPGGTELILPRPTSTIPAAATIDFPVQVGVGSGAPGAGGNPDDPPLMATASTGACIVQFSFTGYTNRLANGMSLSVPTRMTPSGVGSNYIDFMVKSAPVSQSPLPSGAI
jgi:hypothetical protein